MSDRKRRDDNVRPLITETELQLDYGRLQRRSAELEALAEKQPLHINSAAAQGRLQELIKSIDIHVGTVNSTRASVKAPFIIAGRVVDAFFKVDRLQKIRSRLATLGRDYLERKAAKARARLAEEEARKAKPADLARTRSANGSLGTLEAAWDFEIIDDDELQPAQLWAYVTDDAKEAAIRAYIRAHAPKQPSTDWQPLAGVRMLPVTRAKYY